MQYADRVTELISGHAIDAKVAILYHGESEWAGKTMLMQKPARVLYDHQIDYRFVPSDVFSERAFYKTELSDKLVVNGKVHEVFVVPACEYISEACAHGLTELIAKGGRVIFIDKLPKSVTEGAVPESFRQAQIMSLAELPTALESYAVKIAPANDRIRILHCGDVYMLVNEGTEAWNGSLELSGQWHCYDAWNDMHHGIDLQMLTVKPYESLILLPGHRDAELPQWKELPLKAFTRSICRAADYPNFTSHTKNVPLEDFAKETPRFSGFIRYETGLKLRKAVRVQLAITDANEGTEVFVNGISCGIHVVPDPVFDITHACKVEVNKITIEAATTLARERGKKQGKSGICGHVTVRYV